MNLAIPTNMNKLKELVVTSVVLLPRAICVFVGFLTGLIGYRDSRYGLLMVSLFLIASAAVSLQIPNLSIGEKHRIPAMLALLVLVFVIL